LSLVLTIQSGQAVREPYDAHFIYITSFVSVLLYLDLLKDENGELLADRYITCQSILFGTRMKCHSSGSYLLLYPFINRVIKLTVVITEGCHCYQLHRR
jgi:hypothetical protein